MIKVGDKLIRLINFDVYEITEVRIVKDRNLNYNPSDMFFDSYHKQILIELQNKNMHRTAYYVYDDDYSFFFENYITIAEWRAKQIDKILEDE